jgi:dihydroorotate dehydrogenase/Pyruvate/2-oxoacid:ferredoxin oxidoreductase delta subunit
MVDLTTTYAGVELKNPLIVGSGPPTHTPEICEKAAKAGWAGVVLKTVTSTDVAKTLETEKVMRAEFVLTDPSGVNRWKPRPPRQTDPRSRDGKKLGKIPPDYGLVMGNPITAEGGHANVLSYFQADRFLEYIGRTKKLLKGTDCKVIASIYSYTQEGWEELCDLVNQSDADMVELNFGCAYVGSIHPQTGQWRGEGAGVYPELVQRWTKLCTERIKIPIATKLPPHCPDILASARACQENGSQGIQYADGDIFRNYPVRPVFLDPDTMQVGYFPGVPWATVLIGTVSLPYILGGVTLMRTRGDITVDISGCSSVRSYMDVIRYLMCGATSVQVCVAAMVEGVGVGAEYLEGITSWMRKKGYKSLKDIIGLLPKDRSKLKVDPSKWYPIEVPRLMGGPMSALMVEVHEKRCITCGWCEQCCPHLAINIDGKIPAIDRQLCEVCGLCVGICPVDALSIVPS